jgi:hypothetical protein
LKCKSRLTVTVKAGLITTYSFVSHFTKHMHQICLKLDLAAGVQTREIKHSPWKTSWPFERQTRRCIFTIYSLTAIELSKGGSNTVHIYTQTMRRTTQIRTKTTQITTTQLTIPKQIKTIIIIITYQRRAFRLLL